MNLFLKDFSLREESNKSQEDEKEKLLNEIDQLLKKIEYLESLREKEKQEIFEDGYKRGKEEGYSVAKSEFEVSIKSIEEKKRSELMAEVQSYIFNLEQNVQQLNKQYNSIVQKTIELISDAIGEILEFLYLDSENISPVLEQIVNLIEEFYDFPNFVIKVGNEDLAKVLGSRYPVEIDKSLKGLDFVLDFKEFKVESKIEEKIRIVKDEIKREIKKLSEV